MKKIEIKPLVISLILIAIQGVLYLIVKCLEGTPHLIGNSIDQKTPCHSSPSSKQLYYFCVVYVIEITRNTHIHIFSEYRIRINEIAIVVLK